MDLILHPIIESMSDNMIIDMADKKRNLNKITNYDTLVSNCFSQEAKKKYNAYYWIKVQENLLPEIVNTIKDFLRLLCFIAETRKNYQEFGVKTPNNDVSLKSYFVTYKGITNNNY